MRNAVKLAGFAAFVSLFAPAAFAQGVDSTPSWHGSITIGEGTTLLRTPVTGGPYSATEVMEHTQILADGTHIVRKLQTTLVFRDSQGRTRTERSMTIAPNADPNRPRLVQIHDPIAGFVYTLDQHNHVAHRVAMTKPDVSATPEEIPRPAPRPAADATQVNRTQRSSESLGTQVMEGVTVQGRRITTTVPVGVQGNDRPLVSTIETWWSPDIKATVLSKNSDLRNGESIVRLTDIIVGEPDSALFRPPPDYTVVDEKGAFTFSYGGSAPQQLQ